MTTYDYDEADRLVKVCAGPGGGFCAQQRLFAYDNRGFLISETHPETGPAGHGATKYTYDASGNVLSKDVDVDGTYDFDLSYRYDPANRLIAVDEVTGPGTTRPLKSFHYARANGAGDVDRRAGKLVLSKRINWVLPVDPLPSALATEIPATISQAYRYEGRDGRVSHRQTRSNLGVATYAFETGYEYDDLGNVDRLVYPRCLHEPCAGTDPARSVEYTYQRGFLSSVGGFATNLYYQLGGMLKHVVHANGVTETIETSARNFQRITTTSGWDSGVYAYDGSGNVKQIGTQVFKYDKMSRLLEGQVEVGGEIESQNMAYDRHGNIVSLETADDTLSTPIHTDTDKGPTNRLADATYDAGGNLTRITLGGAAYQYAYDALNMMSLCSRQPTRPGSSSTTPTSGRSSSTVRKGSVRRKRH